MLSTFQDWPAAGTITANGNTEAESMCEKCICGSEYFIQAFFGDVPCALSSPSRSRALATHSCFFYVIRLLCLHTFMWHKSWLDVLYGCCMHTQRSGNDMWSVWCVWVRARCPVSIVICGTITRILRERAHNVASCVHAIPASAAINIHLEIKNRARKRGRRMRATEKFKRNDEISFWEMANQLAYLFGTEMHLALPTKSLPVDILLAEQKKWSVAWSAAAQSISNVLLPSGPTKKYVCECVWCWHGHGVELPRRNSLTDELRSDGPNALSLSRRNFSMRTIRMPNFCSKILSPKIAHPRQNCRRLSSHKFYYQICSHRSVLECGRRVWSEVKILFSLAIKYFIYHGVDWPQTRRTFVGCIASEFDK